MKKTAIHLKILLGFSKLRIVSHSELLNLQISNQRDQLEFVHYSSCLIALMDLLQN